MESAGASGTFVPIYQNSRRYISEEFRESNSSYFKMLTVGSFKKFVSAYQNALLYIPDDREQRLLFYLEISGKISPRNIEPTYQIT
jgi:hypothetical protein